MKTSRLVLAAAAVVAAAALLGGCKRARPEAGFYASKKFGFSIRFPKGWDAKDGEMKSAVTATSPAAGAGESGRLRASVSVEDLPESLGLEKYFALYMSNLSLVLPPGEEPEVGDAALGGLQAKRVVYNMLIGKIRSRQVAYVLAEGKRGYILTCGAPPDAFDEAEPEFRKIAESLRVE